MKHLKWVLILAVVMIGTGAIGAAVTFPNTVFDRTKVVSFSKKII